MKTTVTKGQFTHAFINAGRKDQFSYEALELLFDYLTEMEREAGEEFELDVIELCCEYVESTVDELVEEYALDEDDDKDEDEKRDAVRKYLDKRTLIVGETCDGFVYAIF